MTNTIIQIPANYDGKRYLQWLNGDCLSAQNIMNSLFRGGMTNDTTDFVDLLKASKQVILDLEEDTAKLKETLDSYSQYLPQNEDQSNVQTKENSEQQQ